MTNPSPHSRAARSGRRQRRSRLSLALVTVGLVAAVFGLRAMLPGADDETPQPPVSQAAGRVSPSPSSLARTAASPKLSATPTPVEVKGRLVIHGTGDVNVDPGYISTFRTYGYGYAWSGLGGLFQRDDLTVVNLECAVSNLGSAVPKEFNFRGDPAALPVMKAAGVDVASMANNHAYDYGPQALLDTRKNIARAGMAPVGGGKDPQEALAPASFEIKGWRIAVLGFDQVVDPYPEAVAAPGHPGTAAGHDVDAMVAAIEAADAEADLVVVIIHWGVELDTVPRAEQVTEAHRFVDAGADVIFGSHSHRLEPLGTYKGRPIFWGLGNFVWPNHSVAGSTTAVAEVTITPAGKLSGRLIPAYIESAGHPVLRGR